MKPALTLDRDSIENPVTSAEAMELEPPLPVSVSMAAEKPRNKRLDLKDMLEELPMLAALKDQKWMGRLPRNMFPKRKKSPRTAGIDNIPQSTDELNQFLRTEISAVDVAKDVILEKLKDDVRANYNSLIQGMKVVQEVDLDLVRAQIHVDICIGLRKGLSRKELQGVTILDEIRLRMQNFIPKLRAQFDQHFDPVRYKELLQAYITLADHSENLDFEFSSYTLSEVLSNIPEIIVRSIDEMTTQFMHQAFDTGSPRKAKTTSKNKQPENNSPKQNGDVTSTPASETIEKVTRCYERLTELMHTYYLLVQIRSVLRVKCEQYLHTFHDDNVELTRMLLDAENWQRVTASMTEGDDNFGLLKLIEKRSGYFFEQKVRADLTVNPIYFRRVLPSFHTQGNPFSTANSMTWLSLKQGIRFQHETGGIASDPADKSDLSSPRGGDDRPFPIMDPNESEFVLNSSTLAGFVRLCGVYLKMMEHLPHIGWDVFRSLNNLFEFNLFAVFTSFIAADDITDLFRGNGGCQGKADATRWNGLRSGICRIADDISVGEVLLQSSVLIYPTAMDPGRMEQPQNAPISRKVTLRRLNRTPAVVEDADESNLYALAERSIACEAIVAQSRLLNAIEGLARSYLPDRYLCLMDEVYERNRTMARELRNFMYATIAMKLVDVPALLDSIAAVPWDIPYISDQHNVYIVDLVRKCGEAWGGLQILADGSISMDAREEIWAATVQTIMDSVLLGFSTVTKATPQGHALMLMDLHALQNGLDLINHISSRTVPRGREYVGNYIKAFYHDEDELLQWIQANKTQYSKRQFVNLIKNGIGSTLELKKLRELVLKIDAILS
ncbi:hypothetical protein BBJ28_00002743 [Nothophytophthora sp. Chile5]|nr:hypothetical protein BBJ28_00002743 [Nothophytophthora sp. Chile5]